MAQGRWRTHLSVTYWRLGEDTREVCLNCPLPDCVEFEEVRKTYGLSLADCPLPRTSTGTVLTKDGRMKSFYDGVERVAEIVGGNGALPVQDVAEKSGVPYNTLRTWIRRGRLKGELRRAQTPRGPRKKWFICGVDA